MEWLKEARRYVRGTRWRPAGFTTRDDREVKPVGAHPFARLMRGRLSPWFLGETFIYVVRRPPRGETM